MNKNNIYTFFYIIFIFCLIATSGSAAFFSYELGYYFIFPVILFILRGMRIPLKHILFLLATLILIFTQNFNHNNGNINLYSSLVKISTILTIYLISRLVAYDFPFLYRKIVITISIISLFFWTGIQLSGAFGDYMISFAKTLPQLMSDEKLGIIHADKYVHLYIHTFYVNNSFRNAGLFYEPGRFAIFLGIALAINLFRNKAKLFDKEDLLYILTMVTTFSTTGYFVMLLLIFTRILISHNKPFQLILAILVFPFLIWYINTLDFMWDKVSVDYGSSESYSRFAAMAYHYELISQSPIIGWGYNVKELELSPNGLTFLILRWGAIFSAFYFTMLYKGIPTLIGISKSHVTEKIMIYLALILLAFSQTITTDSFYFALMFFGLNNFKRV